MDTVFAGINRESPVDYAALNDRALLARAADRDDRATHELVARYGRRLYSVVDRSHGDLQLSEDIVQDTLFKAIESHRQLRSENSVFPWLIRIALRRALDYRRKRRRESLVDILTLSDRPGLTPDTGTALDESRERNAVRHALARLKPYHRELLTLRYYSHLSVGEIADIYEKNEPLVRKDLQRARAQLERRLPSGFGDDR
ncbi:MAG: RNA polymerase sigma factor [Myxococcota bacterium]